MAIDLYFGNAQNIVSSFKDNSINLIVTSPPYADQRKSTYGGIHPDKYVEWFIPISEQLLRVLKEDGSFILNIKEKVVNKERHPYVMELVLAMRKQGWKLTDQYIWHKKNGHPGYWNNRLMDLWESCFHFNKTHDFYMDQEAVKMPIGDWAKTRLSKLSDKDKERQSSQVGSGFGKNISNWVGKDKVLPGNVLHFATECSNKNHSAAFPKKLPEFFIKLFSKENDIVLDPFAGSGTTLFIAKELNRNSIGIELNKEYYDNLKQNIER